MAEKTNPDLLFSVLFSIFVDIMRYFAELRYDGGVYCGWQRQPDAPTVQGVLEAALSKILREPVETVGAGRTDTGVNASYYVAHFDVGTPFDAGQLLFKLNSLLPPDVAVDTVTPVGDSAHARYDAREREYVYFISRVKNPFIRNSAWIYRGALDLDAMNAAAHMLPEYDDFTSFAKLNSNNKTNICRIYASEWSGCGEGVLKYTVRADRFLRNMVRSLVGTMVDVGRGRLNAADFRAVIEARDLSRSSAGAPPQGLFLNDIRYPEDVFSRRTNANLIKTFEI